MKIKTYLLVFWKIWTSKMASNGRWLRATVLPEEEEGGLRDIYRKNNTCGWLKEQPMKIHYNRRLM